MPPLRMIAFLGLYGVLLLAAFVFPAAGVWGFLFESNYHPPYNPWWGEQLAWIGSRWSLYIGAVMIAATLLHWGRNNVKVFRHPQTLLLIAFTLNTCAVSFWAYDEQASWKEATDNLKWLLVYVCIIKTHSDRRWLPVILYIYIIAAIDAGWQCTFDPKPGRFVRGGPVTATFDENFVAAHVIALLPLVGLYAMSPGINRWLRITCLLGAPLMMNIVAHAQSRGGFLAMAVAGCALPIFARGRVRTIAIVGLVLGAVLAVRLFHEQFWERMASIVEDGQTGAGRTVAWADAWDLVQQNPFGYGGEAFDRGLARQDKSTHNMYFECLVAWGYQGTVLWLAFIGTSLYGAWKLAKQNYRKGSRPDREYLESIGIFIGMLSMLVSAVFINRMRWELWWVLPAYAACLQNVYGRRSQLSRKPRQRMARRPARPRHVPEPARV